MEGGRPSGQLAGSLLVSILRQLPLSISLMAEGALEIALSSPAVSKPTGNHTGEVYDAFPSFSPTKEKNMRHETWLVIASQFQIGFA